MNEDLLIEEKGFSRERIWEFVFKNRWVITGLLLGLIFLGAGLLMLRAGFFEGTKVEVIEESSAPTSAEVVVEISGAVQNPGVYKLKADSRIEDLLIAAGGLSAEADREWVQMYLNRAAKLLDGQKIYIPKEGENVKGSTSSTLSASSGQAGSIGSLININTATQAQLESLWGIGPARAADIIDSRPFSSTQELLTRKIIPQNVFERIKDEITAP